VEKRIRTRAAVLSCLALGAATWLYAQTLDPLAEAQERLDAGAAQAALEVLDPYLEANPTSARAFLLRSTCRFMLGDLQGGKQDLHRSLELDPDLRQGWLNRAAVDMSEQRYEDAYHALLKARELDPSAGDSDLNIGAVLLLMGRLQDATESFQRYLVMHPGSADAYYLVSSNYALAGYSALSMQHLRQAIELNEKSRVRARVDPNFAEIASDPRFQELLATDSYRLPPGAYVERRTFDAPYDGTEAKLLGAVLNALQRGGFSFDSQVEVTPEWALIWGAARLKVSKGPEGRGAVQISAPADRMTPRQWQEMLDRLFRQLRIELLR
jgi:tetratricopeptide (TPR) repeat protein